MPYRLRRKLYAREGAYWYGALIRNARDRREELERIDARLAKDDHVGSVPKALLRRRIVRHLMSAAAEEKLPGSAIQAARDAGVVEDTTGYEKPVTTIIFFPRRGRDE